MTSEQVFWIGDDMYAEMLELARHQYPRETGGMLLGYEAEAGSAVITKIIGPGPNAKHRRFRFIPDGDFQQVALEAYFWANDGRETYLGDWHTHPTSDSAPSRADKRTLAKIATEPLSGTKQPLMAILGGGSGDWQLSAVRFLSANRRLLYFDYRLAMLQVVRYHQG